MAEQPGLTIPPPGVTSDEDMQQYLELLRRQQIAQYLTQSALTPAQVQQPVPGGRYYQEARVHPLQGVMKLVGALMAKKATQESNAQQAPILAKGMAMMSGAPQGQQSAPPAAPFYSSYGGSDNQMPPQQQPSAPAVNPYNPEGLPPDAMYRLRISDPAKYAEMIRPPQGYREKVLEMGGDADFLHQTARAKALKDTAVAVRANQMAQVPDGHGGLKWVRNPDLPVGMNQQFDENGEPIGAPYSMPNVNETLAARKMAEEGAGAQNRITEIPGPGGSMSPAYAGNALGTPPGLRGLQPNVQPAQGAPMPAPQPAPHPAAQSRKLFPDIPPLHGAAPAPQQQANVLPQKDQNGIFSNNLWQGIQQRPQVGAPGRTPTLEESKTLESMIEKRNKLSAQYGVSAATGQQALQFYNEAQRTLPQASVGPMSEYLTHNRSILLQMGVPPNLIPNSGSVTPTLELNKALKNAALQGAKATYGRLTQMEVKLQTDEMSPSPSMTHDAISALIRQNKMRAAYEIQQNKDFQEHWAQHGDPFEFEAQYPVRRSLPRFAAQYNTPDEALRILKSNPSTLPTFIKKFHWDPTQ
jgi:hypothetical protein